MSGCNDASRGAWRGVSWRVRGAGRAGSMWGRSRRGSVLVRVARSRAVAAFRVVSAARASRGLESLGASASWVSWARAVKRAWGVVRDWRAAEMDSMWSAIARNVSDSTMARSSGRVRLCWSQMSKGWAAGSKRWRQRPLVSLSEMGAAMVSSMEDSDRDSHGLVRSDGSFGCVFRRMGAGYCGGAPAQGDLGVSP